MSFRFVVDDLVRVVESSPFAPGSLGRILSIEYVPDGASTDDAEYMVEFEESVTNPSYAGNEEWESPTHTEGYFTDVELEPRIRMPKKRISGFGRFINRIEDES